ncbi:hypothetical protein LTR66_010382 [Elasticomyces elasticus]|nr:hypothetical protein LTR66_010382 [Elasticomyces elasticus]
MAPTKPEKGEKTEKLSADQSTALMLDYLRKQNRPYSATDISANLKNRVTKAAAAKLLKDMHERKEIEGRASGGSSVCVDLGCDTGDDGNADVIDGWYVDARHYLFPPTLSRRSNHAMRPPPPPATDETQLQSPADAATPEDLADLDAEIQRLRNETVASRADEKTLKTALATLSTTVSLSDLRASVQLLEAERHEMTARLTLLRSGSAKPIVAGEKARVDAEMRRWGRAAAARKGIKNSLWALVCDNLPEGTKREELKVRGSVLGECWVVGCAYDG